jgi:hypothetical protein
MMLQRVAAGIVGGVLMSAVLVAPAASAVTDSEAKANMLNETEVPAIFGKAKDYDFNSKVIGKSIGICGTPEGKTLVSVPAPSSQFVVDIETRNKKTYTDVMERVYQFPTAAAAQASFQTLATGLSTCNGVRTAANGPTGSIKDITSTGSPAGGEYEVFFVQVNARFNDTDKRYRDRTSVLGVYTQAGDAIIETFAYVNPATRISVKQRNALLDLGQQLSAKWVG